MTVTVGGPHSLSLYSKLDVGADCPAVDGGGGGGGGGGIAK